MSLQQYTKIIDNFLANQHAISLLHTFYTDLPEEEKAIFVTALIGQAVVSYKLAQQTL